MREHKVSFAFIPLGASYGVTAQAITGKPAPTAVYSTPELARQPLCG